MNEEEKKLSNELFAGLSLLSFRAKFRPGQDDSMLVRDLLEEALESKDSEEVEWAILVGSAIGYLPQHITQLAALLRQDWHCKHEDIVRYIEPFKSEEAAETLVWAAQVRLAYLAYNDSSALARKAIYALAKIPNPKTREQLQLIAQNTEGQRKHWAIQELERL